MRWGAAKTSPYNAIHDPAGKDIAALHGASAPQHIGRMPGSTRPVAVLELPLVVLLEQDGADQADDGGLVGEDADDVGAALDLAVEPLERVGGVQLGPVLGREGHVGEHVGLALVHQGGELGPARPELVGDVAPGLAALPRRSGWRKAWRSAAATMRVLALAGMGEGVAHEVHAAALPGGAEHPGDRRLQPLVGVGDDQLDAAQAAAGQALEEARPERSRPPTGRCPGRGSRAGRRC